MNSWRLGFADSWPTWNKMLCMICYMLHCKHLHDRYDKSGFFFFSDFIFHYWAAFMVYQQNRVNNTTSSSLKNIFVLTIFKMGLFGLLTDQGAKMPTSIKSHTYPKMMKLGTVIPYLTKIQNIYKSRDTPINFCWHPYFFTKNQQLVISRNTDIDCSSIHNC